MEPEHCRNELNALVCDFVERLCLKASCAALQPPLLAEKLPLGLSVAAPKRTAASLRWLLRGERPANAPCDPSEQEEAGLAVVDLCALLVSETVLVHYTPRPKGITPPPIQQSGEEAIDEKYWKRRYNYFARFDEGIRMDPGAWFEVTPESVARHIADRFQYDTVVDGTCGVGGNAIQFAMTSRSVVAVDTDAQRLADARHNARIYGVADRIRFVHDDFVKFADNYTGAPVDAVFLSPPWGGPGHLDCPHFSLRDVQVPDIMQLFAAAAKLCPRVALYLPRHTDLHEVAILAAQHGFPAVEVEKVFFQHPTPHLKLVVVYFSSDVAQQGIPKSITQKSVGRDRAQRLMQSKASVPELLSASAAGVLLRAVYCRSYLGRFVVSLALRLEEGESVTGRTCKAPHRGQGQPRQRLRSGGKGSCSNPVEIQRATAQNLCEAFGTTAVESDALVSARELLAEVPLTNALTLAKNAVQDDQGM
ncbi:unnamed protein product [Durusdinium trenchii]|uniref:Trimethylguanosine synthase n=3 Tax=Durusdinium trenchii TaxID=1381693 RepID=A0ABP0HUH9_9DINO